jgi:hypothetical protein
MGEAEKPRVKRLTPEGLGRLEDPRIAVTPSVEGIAEDWEARVGQVHPDLVRAPGVERALDERRPVE